MQEQMLSLAQDLIRIPSVSSDIEQLHAVIDRVAQEFEALTPTLSQKEREKITIEKIEQNKKPSLVIKNFDGKRADICLNGHLDVVPASEEGQFEPTMKDGKMYARGSVDMKTAASVAIFVFKNLVSQGTDKKLMLILNTDEEVGGADGAAYCAAQGYGGDIMLNPDAPDLYKIITAGKGIYSMELVTRGEAGHSAEPWKADNAIEKTINMYREMKESIEETYELGQDDHRGTSVQLTTIQAGEAHNAIPGEAMCTINIRHTESFTETLLKNMCKHIIKKYDAEIVSEHYGGLVHTPEDDPAIQLYKKVSDEVQGGDLQFEKMHGATDAARFAEKGAITILHGLDGEHLHGKGEYVEIDGIQKLYDIMMRFINEHIH